LHSTRESVQWIAFPPRRWEMKLDLGSIVALGIVLAAEAGDPTRAR
jgi:hypothetical protein